ncbi:oxidoreductase [bacterium F11]|nr:oxidoreductase [bacterium F11]
MIKNRKIRFAIVGCGRISKNHFLALDAHQEQAEFVAVCDNDPVKLKAAQEKTGKPGYPSLEELLKKSNPDVVTLATPSGYHANQAIQVARAGKHVLTEKPMATSWEDGLTMLNECEKAGVHLFVVLQNRLNETLELLKRAIDSNRFGKIYMVNVNVFWARPQSYYDQSSWRGTHELDGGAFMNQAIHYVDLLTWLMGPIESVQAYRSTLARKIEAEDTGVMSIRWKSGALGSVNVTMLTHKKNFEGSITVLGEKGTVRVGGIAVNEIEQWEFETPHEDDIKVTSARYQTSSVYGFGHPKFYENVIKVMKGISHPKIDGREGLKSLETIIAYQIAADTGIAMKLPLEEGLNSLEKLLTNQRSANTDKDLKIPKEIDPLNRT